MHLCIGKWWHYWDSIENFQLLCCEAIIYTFFRLHSLTFLQNIYLHLWIATMKAIIQSRFLNKITIFWKVAHRVNRLLNGYNIANVPDYRHLQKGRHSCQNVLVSSTETIFKDSLSVFFSRVPHDRVTVFACAYT